MKKLFSDTTPFGWRCRKAILLLLALGLAVICALFQPAQGQPVQSMVKNQPFPYAQGVAMDTVLYKAIKAKLEAAEALRNSSEQSIAALQAEITGLEVKLKAIKDLGEYDAHKADSLSIESADLKSKLDQVTKDFGIAQRAFDQVLKELPRRIRKTLSTASPDQIATATVDYIHTLQRRKWYWAGASALGGMILTLTAHFF